MTQYGKHYSTPQSVSTPARGRSMVQTDGGGYGFKLDPFKMLERFLILGAETPTYYVGGNKHMDRNVQCVEECARQNGRKMVDLIVDVATKGRAPKADPYIFAWAYALKKGDDATRSYAASKAKEVLRIGTHVFQAAEDIKALGGWGTNVKRALTPWYLDKSPRDLAYQLVKYQQRGGWSHRDVLRKIRPKVDNPLINAALRWSVRQDADGILEDAHGPIWGLLEARSASTVKEIIAAIEKYDLVREAIPTEWLKEPAVWEALLPKMPLGAMIRNLGAMTANGTIAPLSETSKLVVQKLEHVAKSRVHPMALLMAMRVYEHGGSPRPNPFYYGLNPVRTRSSKTWTPVQSIVDALDGAFVNSFQGIEPTGKNYMIGIDVSGSMGACFDPLGVVTCSEAAAAMAMVSLRTEPNTYVRGFNHHIVDLKLSARDSLSTALKKTSSSTFGSTDPAGLIQQARTMRIPVDVFMVITDNDVNSGTHTFQELKLYRKEMNPNAKVVVMAMISSGFTIADPEDDGMLDVVGFDASVPGIISSFARS